MTNGDDTTKASRFFILSLMPNAEVLDAARTVDGGCTLQPKLFARLLDVVRLLPKGPAEISPNTGNLPSRSATCNDARERVSQKPVEQGANTERGLIHQLIHSSIRSGSWLAIRPS